MSTSDLTDKLTQPLMLLEAEAHKWGEGKTHILNGDKTQCGKQSETLGGLVIDGFLDNVSCSVCAKSFETTLEREARRAQWNYESQEKSRQWWAWYEGYLRTPEWWLIRDKVMRRARGICEGCGEARATQVHHLTYQRVGKEMMFDLVAVCDECHVSIHETKAGT